jgi:hypothetical protein
MTPRRVAALLRIIGWGDNERDVTEAEAEVIFRAAESEPMDDTALTRIRDGVLYKRRK